MGNPRADLFTGDQFAEYRKARLDAGITANNMNREQAYLRAVFNELARLDHWKKENPLKKLRAFKIQERELSYLAPAQSISQIRNGMIQFVQTKSSKARSVPITEALEAELKSHHEKHGEDDRLFTAAWAAFREGVERLKLVLPTGQMTHVLRHTFASHFMMNGGNILVLQRILGHASLTMTMRYAHLAPDHLEEARRLNPLAALTVC